MKLNKHLLKKEPVYKVKDQDYKVVLNHVFKTDRGLCFNAEIIDGEHKGKWTSVLKKDLTLVK